MPDSLLYQSQLLLFLGGDGLRERRIAQPLRVLLARGHHPLQELRDGLLLGWVVDLVKNKHPSEGGDRVSALSRCIGDRNAKIRRHVFRSSGSSLGNTVEVCF